MSAEHFREYGYLLCEGVYEAAEVEEMRDGPTLMSLGHAAGLAAAQAARRGVAVQDIHMDALRDQGQVLAA